MQQHCSCSTALKEIVEYLFKKLLPNAVGWIVFSISEIEGEEKPSATLFSNCLNQHSVKLLTEILNRHIYDHGNEMNENLSKGCLWQRFLEISKKA